jgi:hypothetical protein
VIVGKRALASWVAGGATYLAGMACSGAIVQRSVG